CLWGVDHDHEVADVHVRGERGFVLAAQKGRGVGGEPAQHDVRSVDDVPLTLDLTRLRAVRTHRFTLSGRRTCLLRKKSCDAGQPTLPAANDKRTRSRV